MRSWPRKNLATSCNKVQASGQTRRKKERGERKNPGAVKRNLAWESAQEFPRNSRHNVSQFQSLKMRLCSLENRRSTDFEALKL